MIEARAVSYCIDATTLIEDVSLSVEAGDLVALVGPNGGLGELRFPLASDITHRVAKDYGVFHAEKGHALRGTFLIDPKGILRMSLVNDLDVGRSVDETLRTLQALKTGALCPVGWQPGQATL